MNHKAISKIFLKRLGLKVTSIKDSSKGVDQNVQLVQTNQGRYILKIPHKEKDKIIKEVIATERCRKLKIPVPKVIYHDNNILIETYIEGKNPSEMKATEKQYTNIYYNLGKLLRKIHSIKCTGFGPITSNKLMGKYSTQKEAIESYMKEELTNLKDTKYYSDEEFNKMVKYYNKNKKFLNSKESVMLHSDFEEGNIMVKNFKVAAVIDFGDLSAGPAMQDLARMYTFHDEEYKFDSFLKGYGNHDLKEIKFYVFCLLTWWIRIHITGKNMNKRFKKASKRYKQIWS